MKRRRENDDENVEPQNSKMAKCHSNATITSRSMSTDLRSSVHAKAASENAITHHQQLSASHKQVSFIFVFFPFVNEYRLNESKSNLMLLRITLQKLLWAVSTALKKKSVVTSHEHFNNYASVLAKVVKRLYLETTTSKLESTSATMLRWTWTCEHSASGINHIQQIRTSSNQFIILIVTDLPIVLFSGWFKEKQSTKFIWTKESASKRRKMPRKSWAATLARTNMRCETRHQPPRIGAHWMPAIWRNRVPMRKQLTKTQPVNTSL